jgi:hypothetical protein
VSLREEEPGRWVAESLGPHAARRTGRSQERALAGLRRSVRRRLPAPRELNFIVEVVPRLAGVAEAAQVMGWDKRRVITYIDRGRFPEPIQSLASGRVWVRKDLEEFAQAWHERQRRRSAGGNKGDSA